MKTHSNLHIINGNVPAPATGPLLDGCPGTMEGLSVTFLASNVSTL